MKLVSMNDIHNFLAFRKRNEKILFVIDQMNALDPGYYDGCFFTPTNNKKQGLRYMIRVCVSGHNCISSTSANYEAFTRLKKDNNNRKRLDVFGGLSVVSPSINMLHVYSTKHLYRQKWNSGGNGTKVHFLRTTRRMNSKSSSPKLKTLQAVSHCF